MIENALHSIIHPKWKNPRYKERGLYSLSADAIPDDVGIPCTLKRDAIPSLREPPKLDRLASGNPFCGLDKKSENSVLGFFGNRTGWTYNRKRLCIMCCPVHHTHKHNQSQHTRVEWYAHERPKSEAYTTKKGGRWTSPFLCEGAIKKIFYLFNRWIWTHI